MVISALGEATNGVELLEGAAAGGGRRDREEVADVEQDLEHQLVALVSAVELGHAAAIARGLGPVVGLAVDGLEVGEDALTGTHDKAPGVRAAKEEPGAGVCASL